MDITKLHPRQQAEMVKVPEEYRDRAWAEAHTLTNILGGIMSANLSYARRELQANIDAGHPEKELYGEEFARAARDREAELRRVSGNPAAIYNPFR